MDTILDFLHTLRRQVVEKMENKEGVIVRIDVDNDTSPDSLKLVVIWNDRYQAWYVSAEEWNDLDTLLNQVMDEIFKK